MAARVALASIGENRPERLDVFDRYRKGPFGVSGLADANEERVTLGELVGHWDLHTFLLSMDTGAEP